MYKLFMLDEKELEIATQLIHDGYTAGNFEELVATAKRLAY